MVFKNLKMHSVPKTNGHFGGMFEHKDSGPQTSSANGQARLELLPLNLIDKVAIDEQKLIAYTDARTSGHPYFLSWLNKNERRGLVVDVQTREISQIAVLREEGYVQKAIDGEKKDLCVSVDKMEEIYVECAIMGITQLFDFFHHEYLYFIAKCILNISPFSEVYKKL